MNNLTISIFKNQTFLNILNEIKLISEFKFINSDDINSCIKEAKKYSQIVVVFKNSLSNEIYQEIVNAKLPLLAINNSKKNNSKYKNELIEEINMPFKILDFQKKIISLQAKYEFNKTSLINLGSYTIDRNERKIKKDNLELKLTEKEIDFLILFTTNNKPVNRDFVLKKVWKYSSKTDTHTIETHIHRLRKKILQKFNDKNFIKNDNSGYYI